LIEPTRGLANYQRRCPHHDFEPNGLFRSLNMCWSYVTLFRRNQMNCGFQALSPGRPPDSFCITAVVFQAGIKSRGSSMFARQLRRFRALCVLRLVLCTIVVAAGNWSVLAKEPFARDWQQYPAVLEIDADTSIVAVGDIHGDYERLGHLLNKAGLIAKTEPNPKNLKWSGGSTILVCTGDLIDKGKHSLDVIECFRTLQEASARVGGRTIVTMGNHEAEFLADPEHDEKAEQFVAELDDSHLDPIEVAAGKDRFGVGAFLRQLPFAVRINDWFFAHACSTQGKTMANPKNGPFGLGRRRRVRCGDPPGQARAARGASQASSLVGTQR
jgi:hypothetical protein